PGDRERKLTHEYQNKALILLYLSSAQHLTLGSTTRDETMDQKRLTGSIEKTWNDSIIERLIAYVRIPNKSPQFDPNWERNGHMEAAVKLMADWCRAQPLPGSRVEVRRLPGRTPLLLVDVPG